MEWEKEIGSVGRASKLAAFLKIVALLVVFSQFSVSYTVNQQTYPLPDNARSRVMVSAINGAAMTTPGNSLSEDGGTEAEPITFQTSNLTDNEALIKSNAAEIVGCNTEFRYGVNISFTAVNELVLETRGTANVTVYNSNNGKLLGIQVVTLDLVPGKPVTATLPFDLASPEADPIFLVKVSFPTVDQMGPSRQRFICACSSTSF